MITKKQTEVAVSVPGSPFGGLLRGVLVRLEPAGTPFFLTLGGANG
jgi:hypothetical protein